MSTHRLLLWLLLAGVIALWVTIVLTSAPLTSSPACVAGLNTLEALPGSPGVTLIDEVEAACGR